MRIVLYVIFVMSLVFIFVTPVTQSILDAKGNLQEMARMTLYSPQELRDFKAVRVREGENYSNNYRVALILLPLSCIGILISEQIPDADRRH